MTNLTAVAVPAQHEEPSQQALTGKWTLAVESPHGSLPLALSLTQEGAATTGTLQTPHGGLLHLQGALAGNQLTLKTAAGETPSLTLELQRKTDGILEGFVTDQDGRVPAAAYRH